MDEMKNAEKKGSELRTALKITAITIIGVILLFVGGCFGFSILGNMYFGGYQVDRRISLAKSCMKAVDSSIADYYEAEHKKIPADKEYTINAVFGPDGLVSEPCEFFPESVNQNYYGEHSRTPYYIIIKYKEGEFSEMWMSRDQLADDELIPYSRDEMQEQFGVIKADRDVIVYIGYRSKTEYYH